MQIYTLCLAEKYALADDISSEFAMKLNEK